MARTPQDNSTLDPGKTPRTDTRHMLGAFSQERPRVQKPTRSHLSLMIQTPATGRESQALDLLLEGDVQDQRGEMWSWLFHSRSQW